jgi:TetR/AcrR family transcriptional regulator, mexJK operon transcriptional repressor
MSSVRTAPAAPTVSADSSSAAAPPRRGRGRLRLEDVRELESQLIAAAREAFMTHGYGATSMAALARSAGVSKTTLYAKFPTKAALFRAIIDQQLEEAYGAVDAAVDEAPESSLASSLRHLAEQTLLHASQPENQALNRLIDWEAPRFPELAEVAQGRLKLSIGHIAGYIRDFAARDAIPCRDPEGAAELFNFTVRGLYHEIRMGVRSAAPDEIRARVAKIVEAFLASRSLW